MRVDTPLLHPSNCVKYDQLAVMSSKPELTALVERLVRGEKEAFTPLYDELAPVLFGVVTRVLRDPAMSEEVTQEVFAEIWYTIERFDPSRSAVSTWAITIARRRAVDRVRHEQGHRNRIVTLGHLATDDDSGVDDTVVASVQAERVRNAVASLPDDQSQIIRLAFLDGHTHEAISDLLGLPLGTVKGRVRSGLKRLRADLKSEL